MSRSFAVKRVLLFALAACAASAVACSSEPTATVGNKELNISDSKAASTDIGVTAVTPDSATRDTTIDVAISGSGFTAEATATWALSGVADPAQVRTNRTTYVSSRKIIANITISAIATIGKWDVQVRAGTKGGIGTEMFAIKIRTLAGGCGGRTTLLDSRVSLEWASLTDMGSTAGVTSDGGGVYAGGSQGVKATLPYYDATCASGGDVIFDPDDAASTPARKLMFFFPAGNDAGLPSNGVAGGPYTDIPAIMQLGSDVTWDPQVPVGRDAYINAKYGGIEREKEHPSLTADYPGYPASVTPPLFQSLGVPGCERLTYDRIRRTRVAGAAGFEQLVGQRAADGSPLGRWDASRNGVWVIESVDTGTPAGHAAQCWTSKRGSMVKNGSPMNMPFRIVVSELP